MRASDPWLEAVMQVLSQPDLVGPFRRSGAVADFAMLRAALAFAVGCRTLRPEWFRLASEWAELARWRS